MEAAPRGARGSMNISSPPLASGAAYGPHFLPPRAAPCTLPSEPFLCARSGGGVRAARTPYAPREAGATRAGGRVGGHNPMTPPRAPPTRRTRARTDVRAHLRVEPPRRARMLLMPSARAPGRRRLARGSRWARFSGALWYHRNAHRNIVRPLPEKFRGANLFLRPMRARLRQWGQGEGGAGAQVCGRRWAVFARPSRLSRCIHPPIPASPAPRPEYPRATPPRGACAVRARRLGALISVLGVRSEREFTGEVGDDSRRDRSPGL